MQQPKRIIKRYRKIYKELNKRQEFIQHGQNYIHILEQKLVEVTVRFKIYLELEIETHLINQITAYYKYIIKQVKEEIQAQEYLIKVILI